MTTDATAPRGTPAGEPPLPGAAHIDPADQMAFLRRHHLSAGEGFVREGGAKVKLVIGATGAGKTHFLAAVLAAARAEGFLTAHVDAGVRPLGGFDLLYQALASDIDFADLARRFAGCVLVDLGYDAPGPAPGQRLASWAAAHGHEVGPLRMRLSEELHRRLAANPDLDYGYATGLLRWCETVLWGAGGGDGSWGNGAAAEGGLLEHWLRGGRVAPRECNRLRLRRSADRHTARLWLRSLLHFIRMAGLPGLVAVVDGLDVLVDTPPRRPAAGPTPGGDRPGVQAGVDEASASGGAGIPPGGAVDAGVPDGGAEQTGGAGQTGGASAALAGELQGPAGGDAAPPHGWGAFAAGAAAARPHYSKQRRDDFYECLRALIDDMGLMPGLLIALGGPPALVDAGNARTGFAAYPALAERLQNEVETIEINRFADEIVLERLWAADPDAGRALAERLVEALAPDAPAGVRRQAVAAARAQWAVRDVAVSAVRRSVLAVLQLTRDGGASAAPGDGGRGADGPGGDGRGAAGVGEAGGRAGPGGGGQGARILHGEGGDGR